MPSALEAARVSVASLPVIDVSGLSSKNAAERQAVGAQLRAACLDKGFFYIRNHGVAETLVDDVFKEAAAFFALPVGQKSEVDKAKSKANRGYEPLQGQNTGARHAAGPQGTLLYRPGARARSPAGGRRHVQPRRQSVACAAAELPAGDDILFGCDA